MKTPKLHKVIAMLALAPNDVADVSKISKIGLIAKVAAQLNKLNLCDTNRALYAGVQLYQSPSRVQWYVMV